MFVRFEYAKELAGDRDKILSRQPVIHWVKNFDEDSGKQLFEAVGDAVNLGQPVLPVVIDSYGGQADGLMAMIEAFRSSPIPVATVVVGKAMSCGAMLAAMGTRGQRYVSPYSRILVHHISTFAAGQVPQVKEDVRQSEQLERHVFGLVDRHCGHEPGFLLDQLKPREGADWYLSPSEAVGLKLADHVGVPTFDIKVAVTMSLSLNPPGRA